MRLKHLNLRSIERYLPKFSATLLALVCCAASIAQVKFNTVVNEKQPGLNDYVQVEYTVENAKSVDRFAPPIFKNFRIIQGPVQSTGMSYINGVVSQYKSISFTIQPIVKGRIIVPGAMAMIDGTMMHSESVPIYVRNEGRGSNNNGFPGISRLFPRAEPEVEEEVTIKPGESIADKIKNNLFVQTDVNKTTCYEGEPVMATFKLCSRLRSESRVLKRPSLNGFSVFDMIEPESNRPTIQTINGKSYNVHLIRQTQLFPLQPGTFDIDPVELDNTVKFIKQTVSQRPLRGPLQQFLDELAPEGVHGQVEEHTFTLASKPIRIIVKPLPANKPAGFNGAVGRFVMQTDWKNRPVAAGDDIRIQLKIKGQGNFSVINPPLVTLPEGFESFDPVIKENVDKTIYPLSGSKTFDYTFISKTPGTYTIPAVLFSYFDPKEARFKTLSSDSFEIRVVAPRKKLNTRNLFPARKMEPASSWKDSPVFLIIVLATVTALGVALITFLFKKKKRKETPGKSQVKIIPATAPPVSKPDLDPLKNARLALAEERSQHFYSEVNRAVWRTLSEKINLPATQMNKLQVTAVLQEKGVDNQVIVRLGDVLNACEIALYTPVHTASDMQQTLDKAEDLIRDLQAHH